MQLAGPVEWLSGVRFHHWWKIDARINHGGDRGNQHTGGKVSSCNLGELGITKTQSHRWQLEARVPEPEFEAYVGELCRARRDCWR